MNGTGERDGYTQEDAASATRLIDVASERLMPDVLKASEPPQGWPRGMWLAFRHAAIEATRWRALESILDLVARGWTPEEAARGTPNTRLVSAAGVPYRGQESTVTAAEAAEAEALLRDANRFGVRFPPLLGLHLEKASRAAYAGSRPTHLGLLAEARAMVNAARGVRAAAPPA
jgi:hypothetical protein